MKQIPTRDQASNILLLERFYGVFLLFCAVLFILGVPFVFYRKVVAAVLIVIVVMVVLAVRRISRQGQPQTSMIWFSVGIWVVLVFLLFAGLPPVTASSCLAIAVTLTVVVNLRAGLIFAVSFFLAWLLYVVLQSFELAPTPYFTGARLTGWFLGVTSVWLVLLPIPKLIHDLRRATSLQKAVLESTTDGILVIHIDESVIDFNQRFIEIWQISKEVKNVKSDREILHCCAEKADNPAHFLSRIRGIEMQSNQTDHDVLTLQDGRTLECYHQPQLLDGQLVGRVWTFRDVTARKQNEEELVQYRRHLEVQIALREESEKNLHMALEAASMWAWRWDIANDQTTWSEDQQALLGPRPPGGYPDLRDMVLEQDRDTFLMKGREAMSIKGNYAAKFRIQRTDGEIRCLLARGRVSLNEQSNPIAFIGVTQDITELERATQAAQDANLAKSRFLATMSHEIRTPMNGILGMAQLLLMPGLKDEERLGHARTIHSSGQALLGLLNDILDVSKIEAGKVQLDAIVFDPNTLLSEIDALFSGACQAKHLQLGHQWHGPSGQRYQGDAHRLRQMMSNLAGNAIKFSTKGSVSLECTEIERDLETALLEFSVADTGIGIPEDKRDLLFKPFSQTESSITREFGGSGLGLSIVSQLAKLMGGDVGVHSVLGQGSRFWFRARVKCLSVGEDTRQHQRIWLGMNQASVSTDPLTGSVLVVEDNLVNRMVIQALLVKLGLTVAMLNDGQQAVNAITHGVQNPDLILMDLHMPMMDGYTAVIQIRQWEAEQNRSHLPIIALTADAFEEDRQRCLAVGMDDFLTKPVDVNALQAALRKWLATSRDPGPAPAQQDQ